MKFAVAFVVRMRLASWWNTTSNTQCTDSGDVQFVVETFDGLSGKNVGEWVWLCNKLARPDFAVGEVRTGDGVYSGSGSRRVRAAISSPVEAWPEILQKPFSASSNA